MRAAELSAITTEWLARSDKLRVEQSELRGQVDAAIHGADTAKKRHAGTEKQVSELREHVLRADKSSSSRFDELNSTVRTEAGERCSTEAKLAANNDATTKQLCGITAELKRLKVVVEAAPSKAKVDGLDAQVEQLAAGYKALGDTAAASNAQWIGIAERGSALCGSASLCKTASI